MSGPQQAPLLTRVQCDVTIYPLGSLRSSVPLVRADYRGKKAGSDKCNGCLGFTAWAQGRGKRSRRPQPARRTKNR
jgi:hypothetical protein